MKRYFERIRGSVKPGHSLAQRASRGVAWMFVLRIADNGLLVTRTIILGRLLEPEHFGLVGMATVLLAFLNSISNTGLDAAIIQKPELSDADLDTAWTMQVARGIAVFVVALALAVPAGRAFNESRLGAIMIVLGAGVLVKGFHNIAMVTCQKELEFPRLFAYLMSASVSGLVFGVIAALVLRNAWALALSNFAVTVVGLLASYALHPYRPRLRFERTSGRQLVQFGRWVWVGSVLVFLLLRGDDFLVGKILGATALGLYEMAYRLATLPVTQITSTIEQVAFPTYSKLQHNRVALKEVYASVVQIIAFVSIPLAGGIAFLGPDFTWLFLGERWMAMVPALQILAIWGMIGSISGTTSSVFNAVGRPDVGTKLQFLKLVSLAALIWPLTATRGITGTALAVMLAAIIVSPMAMCAVIRLIRLRTWSLAKRVLLPLVNTSAMLGTMALLKALAVNSMNLAAIVALSGIGILVYLILAWICDKYAGYGIRNVLINRLADLL